MHLKPFVFSAALAILAPSIGAAWEHQFTRGVDLYRVVDGASALSLVCDPNGVYGSSESALTIEFAEGEEQSEVVSFRFPDETFVETSAVRGRVAKASSPDEVWQPLLNGLRSNVAVEIAIGDQVTTMNLGELRTFSCT